MFSGFSGFASEENLKKKKQAKCAFGNSQVTGKSAVFKAGGIHQVALREGKGEKLAYGCNKERKRKEKTKETQFSGAQ